MILKLLKYSGFWKKNSQICDYSELNLQIYNDIKAKLLLKGISKILRK